MTTITALYTGKAVEIDGEYTLGEATWMRTELTAANARITALEAQLAAVPVEALLNYFDHMWACSYPGAFRDMKAISAWVDAKRQEVQP